MSRPVTIPTTLKAPRHGPNCQCRGCWEGCWELGAGLSTDLFPGLAPFRSVQNLTRWFLRPHRHRHEVRP